MSPRFALVAGEQSGDQLGAALIRELRARYPDAQFVGVPGPRMKAEGCKALANAEELSVMGFVEVIGHLPGLFKLRRLLLERFTSQRPDVFIGIDAPAFNLGLARKLHDAGIITVQYVSPQIWAWRQGRVHDIARALDMVLCLLPFERQLYEKAGLRAQFVGHPLADKIPMQPDTASARYSLVLEDKTTVAVLPGSRRGEVKRLGKDFAGAIRWLHERRPELQFIAPMANPAARELFQRSLNLYAPGVKVKLVDGDSLTALAAADVVLVASGTATLETALSKRPMVVAYRIHPLTSWLVRRFNIVKTPYFAQPNLLAGRKIVPELFQEQVTPESLGAALLAQLDDRENRASLVQTFTKIHQDLKRNASASAADAISSLIPSPAGGQ